MFDFGMFDQGLDGRHNLGYPGFVIRAQQGGAVGGDQGLADIFLQVREFLRVHQDLFFGIEHDYATIVIFNELGIDVLTGQVRAGVHVGQEAHHRDILINIGGKGRSHIAIVVQCGVFQSHIPQFVEPKFWPGCAVWAVLGKLSDLRADWVSILI